MSYSQSATESPLRIVIERSLKDTLPMDYAWEEMRIYYPEGQILDKAYQALKTDFETLSRALREAPASVVVPDALVTAQNTDGKAIEDMVSGAKIGRTAEARNTALGVVKTIAQAVADRSKALADLVSTQQDLEDENDRMLQSTAMTMQLPAADVEETGAVEAEREEVRRLVAVRPVTRTSVDQAKTQLTTLLRTITAVSPEARRTAADGIGSAAASMPTPRFATDPQLGALDQARQAVAQAVPPGDPVSARAVSAGYDALEGLTRLTRETQEAVTTRQAELDKAVEDLKTEAGLLAAPLKAEDRKVFDDAAQKAEQIALSFGPDQVAEAEQALKALQDVFAPARDALQHRRLAAATAVENADAALSAMGGGISDDLKPQLETSSVTLLALRREAASGDVNVAETGTTTLLKQIDSLKQAVAARFAEAESRLEQERKRFAALGEVEAGERRFADELNREAGEALSGKQPRLGAAENAIKDFAAEIKRIQKDAETGRTAKASFDSLKPTLEKLAALDPKTMLDEEGRKAITGIQTQLERFEAIEHDAASQGWSYVVTDVNDLEKLLGSVKPVLAKNGAAAKILEEQAAADKAFAEKQAAQAKKDKEALESAYFELPKNAKQVGIDGGKVFTSPILKLVWANTMTYAPKAQNSSIAGTYSFADLTVAITAWNKQAKFNVGKGTHSEIAWLHVPGGGAIQDKRPKGRDEVQANFISDWGPNGERVNVHANLDRAEWSLVTPEEAEAEYT